MFSDGPMHMSSYISILIYFFLFSGTVGVGFYGNEEASKGCKQLSTAAAEASQHIETIRREVS